MEAPPPDPCASGGRELPIQASNGLRRLGGKQPPITNFRYAPELNRAFSKLGFDQGLHTASRTISNVFVINDCGFSLLSYSLFDE